MVQRIFASLVAVMMTTIGAAATPAAAQFKVHDVVQAPARANAQDADDAQGEDGLAVAATRIGWIELPSGELADGPPPFAWVREEDAGPTLRSIVRNLREVASNPGYQGAVIVMDHPSLRLTQVSELGRAMKDAREAGKTIVTFAEAYDMNSYLLACHADVIVLQHKGDLGLKGLLMEEIYLAGMLEKIGVQADFVQIGRFKGADEQLGRSEPSEAWNQNINALLDSLYEQMIATISENRGLSAEEVEQAIADSIKLSDNAYVERNLIDRLDGPDLAATVDALFADASERVEMTPETALAPPVDNPFALFSTLFEAPQRTIRRDSIALVEAEGPIHSGESDLRSPRAGLLFSAESIGSRTLVETLNEVRDEPLIRGVVLRIDSPGGSALASEVIWQALRDLAEEKPVFVSIGGMAASGGYYIACGGERVFVSPASIVGSIGVVGGKITLGGLYDKLGLTVVRRTRGPLGDLFNSVEPFTPHQRDVVRTSMERIYEQFLDRVSQGRGEKIDDIDAVAQGRLFVGQTAVDNGLADEIATLGEVIGKMVERVGMNEGEYDLVRYPEPMSLGVFLEKQFGGLASPEPSAMRTWSMAVRGVLGERAWRSVGPVLGGVMLLRDEPVLTVLPTPLIVR